MEKIQDPLHLTFGPLPNQFRTPYLHRRVAFKADNTYVVHSGRQEDERAFVWRLPSVGSFPGVEMNLDKIRQPYQRPPLYGNQFLGFIGQSSRVISDGPRIWDVEHNTEVPTEGGFRPEKGVQRLRHCYFDHNSAVDQAGRYLLGGSLHDDDYYYYHIGLWDIATGKLLKRFNSPRVRYNNASTQFTPGGTGFVFAAQLYPHDTHLQVTIWTLDSDSPMSTTVLDIGVDDFGFHFSLDGSLLFAGNKRFSMETGEPMLIPDTRENLERSVPLLQHPITRQKMITVTHPGQIDIRDMTGQHIQVLPARYIHTRQPDEGLVGLVPRVIGASQDGAYYAAGDDNVLMLWPKQD